MDAQAHLLSLGWPGPGHPLHPQAYKQKGHRGLAFDPSTSNTNTTSKTSFSTYPSNGLIKPLLVSQKKGKLGIGKRAHEPQQGNEWWLKGFEKALGDVGKSESERSSGASTPVPLPRVLKGETGRFGALYSFFVSGGEMSGTLEEAESKERRGEKRKSDVLEEERKEEKQFEDVATFMAVRDKHQTRRLQKDKQSADEEFIAVEAFMEARDGKQRKKRKSETLESATSSSTEKKEERRARRRQRREEKETRRAAQAQLNGNVSSEDEAAKALRKAEKKKRKAEMAAQRAAASVL